MDMEEFVSRLQLWLHNIYSCARIHRKGKLNHSIITVLITKAMTFLTEGVGD